MAHGHEEFVSMEQMQARLDDELARERKAKTRNIVLGIVLIVGVWWYMGWIYSNLGQMMDEGEMASMLGDYAEVEVLPKARPLVRDFLLEEVPRGVEDISRAAVARLPQLRAEMLSAFTAPLDAELAALDERMTSEMRRELAASRPRIERVLAALPDDQKREQMADELAALFRTYYSFQSREMVREFRLELASAERHLRMLLLTPPDALSPSQARRQELVYLALATLESTFAGDGASIVDVLLSVATEGLDDEE